MMTTSAIIKQELLRSLDDVGSFKSVGYLPLPTVRNILQIDPNRLAQRYRNRGLEVKIYSRESTCIKGGALFVFDKIKFAYVADKFVDQINEKKWNNSIESILDQIALRWFGEEDAIMPLIRALYGDER